MDNLADINPDDFMEHRQAEGDKALAVKFFVKPLQDKIATLAEGRPIFKDTVYIDIRIPGERDSAACRPATQADIKRFPDHYRAFRNRTSDEGLVGTPLSEWPMITRSEAENMAFFNVKTVEQLANMNDSANHQFRGIHALKAKATEWLGQNKDKQGFAKENTELRAQLAAMQAQLDALSAPRRKVRSTAKPKAREKVDASTADSNS